VLRPCRLARARNARCVSGERLRTRMSGIEPIAFYEI
jgi:hypothetical protein